MVLYVDINNKKNKIILKYFHLKNTTQHNIKYTINLYHN
jgi:hypothetical protein